MNRVYKVQLVNKAYKVQLVNEANPARRAIKVYKEPKVQWAFAENTD